MGSRVLHVLKQKLFELFKDHRDGKDTRQRDYLLR